MKRIKMWLRWLLKVEYDEELEEILVHAYIHDGYRNCGFDQMTTKQKQLFKRVLDEHNLRTFNDLCL